MPLHCAVAESFITHLKDPVLTKMHCALWVLWKKRNLAIMQTKTITDTRKAYWSVLGPIALRYFILNNFNGIVCKKNSKYSQCCARGEIFLIWRKLNVECLKASLCVCFFVSFGYQRNCWWHVNDVLVKPL